MCTACAVLLSPQWLTTTAAVSLGLLRTVRRCPCEWCIQSIAVAIAADLSPIPSFRGPVAPTGPDLYYYEVIECGRRILLTGVLIFIAPYTASQAAAACIFAFGSLLGFELLRPHLDPTDAWLYRLVRRTALLSLPRWCCRGDPNSLRSGVSETVPNSRCC